MRRAGRLGLLALVACARGNTVGEQQLGKLVFEDPGLSRPAGQACADCHDRRSAFRDPESDNATSMGVVPGRFGARNAPSAMYSGFAPPRRRDDGGWSGGLFWDGRADTLEAQAAMPLLNPLEMNNPDKASVVASVRNAPYANMFRALYGPDALDDVDRAFGYIVGTIAAYERGPELAPFTSKYDRYVAGRATLTDSERRGLEVFVDPERGACASCHPPPLFTDFRYANLGIPAYPNNPFYTVPPAFNAAGERHVDHGLMESVKDPGADGAFRVPTLRNIERTGPYGHNGYFQNLPYMLDFLNTRDVGSTDVGTCDRLSPTARCAWPPPEVPRKVDARVGHLGLSQQELADLAAFLETLTDAPK